MSNSAANEWCDNAGTAARSDAAPTKLKNATFTNGLLVYV
jgi:hypothetical protein